MKKIYTFLIVLTFIFTGSYAQLPAYLWAHGLGGPAGVAPAGDEYSARIAVDAEGYQYVIGHFTGTVDFDPGPGTANLISVGDSDIFVAKYTKEGNLVWNFQIGKSGPDDGLSIFLTHDLFYISGSFSGSNVEFDPISGGTPLTSNGGKDMFIAHFDTSGFLFWAHSIGGTGTDVATSVTVDDSGNVYLTGSFQGSVDFDPGAGTQMLNAGGIPSDAFIAKFNDAGIYQWAYDFGSGSYADAGIDITTDDSSNVFAVGIFQSTNIDFDPDPTNTVYLTTHGSYDGYVASYTSMGIFRWAFNIGGSSGDRCEAVAIDTEGNVLVTGRFSESNVDFDPDPVNVVALSAPSNNDAFVAKYLNDGSFRWVRQLGGSSNDAGMDVIANPGNNFVVVTGSFQTTANFDQGGGSAFLSSSGSDDIFVAAFDPGSGYQWAFHVGGPDPDNGIALGYVIYHDSLLLYLSGNFSSSADFDPTAASANISSMGGRDLFIAQYFDPYPVGIPELQASANMFSVFPNPAMDVIHVDFKENVQHALLSVTDLQGKQVRSFVADGNTATLDLDGLGTGIYFLSLTGKDAISHARFMITR